VLRIDEIHDADTLRQVAVLLERENTRLHDRLQQLTTELAHLRGEDAAAAQIHLEFLRELLAQRERALFGDSSERRPRAAGGRRSRASSRTSSASSRILGVGSRTSGLTASPLPGGRRP
jgi:hypothetical protein